MKHGGKPTMTPKRHAPNHTRLALILLSPALVSCQTADTQTDTQTAATPGDQAPPAAITQPPQPRPAPSNGPDHPPQNILAHITGRWDVAGTALDQSGQRVNIKGTAATVAEKSRFLRIDLHLADPRFTQPVDASTLISRAQASTVTLAHWASSGPGIDCFEGELDASGGIITLRQVAPADTGRRVVLRILDASRWSAELWEPRDGKDMRVEAVTFTRAGSQ